MPSTNKTVHASVTQDRGHSRRPDVSVIVSCYNQKTFLPRLLTCLATQTSVVELEVILCDDGSSDGMLDELRSYLAGHVELDVRYIWQPDEGFRLSRSRNNGIRCAKGQILVFVDADMWLPPFFLQYHLDAHSVPHRLVCGMTDYAIESDPQTDSAQPTYVRATTRLTSVCRATWLQTDRPWMACGGANFSIRRADIIYFDERFEGWGSEDRDFAYRLYKKGLSIYLIPRVCALDVHRGDAKVAWNPFKGGDSEGIIAMLKSKAQLLQKYPGDLMLPSLDLVRCCHFDSLTDSWSWGPRREDVSAGEILFEFEAWLRCKRPPRPSGVTPLCQHG